jgi:glycosyltransferase involved in cell wall biosynthesis
MAKDLMLLTGAHPVHRRYGELCTASYKLRDLAAKSQPAPLKAINLLRSSLSVPAGYDYVVCESCYYYPALKRRMGLLGKTKIINLMGGPVFYHLLSGRISGLEKKMLLELLKDVDGHIAYGSYGMELLERLGEKKPAAIAYPFVNGASMATLSKVKPALASHSIAVIATTDPYNKGLDALFSAMETVREHFEDATLNIVTRLEPGKIEDVADFEPDYMTVQRNVPAIADVFSKAALYVQPSRGDMVPVACMEAMAAGVPCIVSDENGMKEFTGKIDKDMVVPVDTERLADAIIEYFDRPQKEKKDLSDRSRKAAAFFNENDMVALFKKGLSGLEARI